MKNNEIEVDEDSFQFYAGELSDTDKGKLDTAECTWRDLQGNKWHAKFKRSHHPPGIIYDIFIPNKSDDEGIYSGVWQFKRG